MVYFCRAFECTNKWSSGSGIHFFRKSLSIIYSCVKKLIHYIFKCLYLKSFLTFPLNDEICCQKWVQAVRRKGFVPSKYSRLCSKHFIEKYFKSNVRAQNHILLRNDAIPSVFDKSINTSSKNQLYYYTINI